MKLNQKIELRNKDHMWLLEHPISHRGLHDNITVYENTLDAFAESVKAGYPIELDVRLSRDDQVVVYHDSDLKRLTGVDTPVDRMTYRELQQLKISDTSATIPLLSDVLECVAGKVPLLVELKNRDPSVTILEEKTASLLNVYQGKSVIESFNPFTILWFKKNAPRITRGQLSGDFRDEDDMPVYRKKLLRYMLLNMRTTPDFIAYDIRCMPVLLNRLCRLKKLPVIGWVTKSLKDHYAAQSMFDNVIFEGYVPPETP